MTTLNKAPQGLVKTFVMADLPAFTLNEWKPRAEQLVVYLRDLLELEQPRPVYALVLPSILDLAEFFQCCELDVFDALYALRQQAYQYELCGLDAPVTLRDPLYRQPTNLRYARFLCRALPFFRPDETRQAC